MKLYFKSNERLKRIFNYFSIFTIIFGTTFGSINSASAASITMVVGETATAADNTVNTPAAMSADDDYTIGDGDVGFNTETSLMTIKSLTSTGGATIATMSGTGGLTITGAVTATAALTIVVNDEADNALSIGGISGAVLQLDSTSVLNYTGAVTHTGTVTAAADGEGTVNIQAATTHSGAIGADAKDIGTLNINAATTIGAASFAKDVNVAANTILTGDLNANTVDMTGATTTLTISDKLLKASGTTSVATMNATGQKVILNTADVVSSQITAATDGFGEVQVDVNNTNMTGDIGTSTSLKVGLLDMDKDLNTAGNIFVDATTIDDAEVLTVSGEDKTMTGTIDGDGAVEGNIVVNSGAGPTKIQTFTGNIGATNELKLLTLTTEATFEGSVKVDNIDLAAATTAVFKSDLTLGANDLTLGDATSTATFSGTSTQTITGGADGEDILGTGIVQISNTSNGGVVFGSNAHLGTNTLQLKLAANANLKNSVTGHTLKDVTTLSGSSIILDDTIVATNVVFTATETLDEDSIHASSFIKMPANFDSGEALVLFAEVKDDDVAAITADVNSALVDTGLVNYVATTTSTDDITVTATETTNTAAATKLNVTTNEAIALRQARTAMIGTAADLDTLSEILSLSNGNTAKNRTDFTEQVAPQDDMISGSTFATKAMTGSLQGVMSSRMASLRSGDAFYGSGMSAGSSSANSAFLQVFGSAVEQGNTTVGTGTQFGYDSNSSGIALGTDYVTDTGSVVGLSLSISETVVDGNGAGNSENNIDSYTGSIYVDKSTDTGYVEGSLTFGRNQNETSRIVNTAGLNSTYSGSYDSKQTSLKIGAGKANAVGTGYVTPFGSVTHTIISTDAYTETSTATDNLRLRVAQDDVSSTVGTVGLKYHNILDNGGSPMISLAVNKEFGDETINSTNTYQGGGLAFTTSTDVEDVSATLGLGYSYSSDGASIEFAYEADANDDNYLSHYGSIKFNKKF
jgi:uncharacterized protein with beta-barrel porin domain